MNNVKLVYQSQSTAELSCGICKQGFQPNELRQHTIELSADKQRVVKQSVVHVNGCLDQHVELEKKAVYDRVVPASRHVPALLTKQSEWLEKNFPQYLQIAKLYPEGVIYPATMSSGLNSGYWLDLPQTSASTTPWSNFGFSQFKALFTAVTFWEFQLLGARALEYAGELKSKLANNTELKSVCSCWIWTHQVAGTSDMFRLVVVLQPLEKELVQAFNNRANEAMPIRVSEECKLEDQLVSNTCKAVELLRPQLLNQVAYSLKLTIKNLTNVDSTSMCYGQSAVRDRRQQTRFRFHFNCQSSHNGEIKDFYVFPHSDVQNTDLLYYIGKTAEPVPLFYESAQETEREMERAGLLKQPLTNYQLVMAYYPRSILKPKSP